MLFLFVDSVKYLQKMFKLKQINKDNKKLLKNILKSKSQYDHIAMEIDYQVQTGMRTDGLVKIKNHHTIPNAQYFLSRASTLISQDHHNRFSGSDRH